MRRRLGTTTTLVSASCLLAGVTQAAFFSTLPVEEEAAFAQLLAQPMPAGGMEAAHEAWGALDLSRLLYLKQQAQLKLKQPGLSPDEAAKLQQRVLAFNKEYLDRTRRASDTH
jgi:hypothetical protein